MGDLTENTKKINSICEIIKVSEKIYDKGLSALDIIDYFNNNIKWGEYKKNKFWPLEARVRIGLFSRWSRLSKFEYRYEYTKRPSRNILLS